MASTCLDFHSPILYVILVVGVITGCVVTLASLLTVGIVRARNKERRVESRRASRRIGSKQWRAVLSDPRSQRVGTETSQSLPVALRGEATPDQVRFTPGNDCGDQIDLCSLGYDTLDYWQHNTAYASTLGVAGHTYNYSYGGGSIDVPAASDFKNPTYSHANHLLRNGRFSKRTESYIESSGLHSETGSSEYTC